MSKKAKNLWTKVKGAATHGFTTNAKYDDKWIYDLIDQEKNKKCKDLLMTNLQGEAQVISAPPDPAAA